MQCVAMPLIWLFSFFHRFYLCVDGRRTCGVLLIFFLLAFLSPFLQKKCYAENTKIDLLFYDFNQDSLSQSERTKIADEIIRRFRIGEDKDKNFILDLTRRESESNDYVEASKYIRKELGYSDTRDLQTLRNTLADPSQDIEKRYDAVMILSDNKDPNAVQVFRQIVLDPNEDASLRMNSLSGIRTTQKDNDFSEFFHILNENDFNFEEGSPQDYLIRQAGHMGNDKIFRHISDLIFSQRIDNKKIPSEIRFAFYRAAKNSPNTRSIFLSLLRDKSIEDTLFKSSLLLALLEKDIMSVTELIGYGFTENQIKKLLREQIDLQRINSLMQDKKYSKKENVENIIVPTPQGPETSDNQTAATICSDNRETSPQIEATAKNIETIVEWVDSKAIQKSENISKAREIERQLRDALERFDIDAQRYEVSVEPIENEIIRLNNEINSPLPFTFEKLVTEVAEVFGYNEFGTHESRRREIEKKRFEIWKKEREILNPALEELKTTYDEGVRFFDAYSSYSKKSFSSTYLNELELLAKGREMLSEFSKLQQKQNHN